MKKNLITLALALLFAGLWAVATPPANAGQGASQSCNNGIGNETPIMTSPITLGVQRNPDGVFVCYSTTPSGAPSGAGGVLEVRLATDLSTVGVTARAICYPDTGTIFAPSCDTNTNGASVGSPSYSTGSTTFARDTGGPCLWVLGTQYLSTCSSATTVSYYGSDGPGVSMPSTGVCLISAGSTCYVYLTGVKVTAGYDPTSPLVTVDTPFGRRDIDAPKTCYGVMASCP